MTPVSSQATTERPDRTTSWDIISTTTRSHLRQLVIGDLFIHSVGTHTHTIQYGSFLTAVPGDRVLPAKSTHYLLSRWSRTARPSVCCDLQYCAGTPGRRQSVYLCLVRIRRPDDDDDRVRTGFRPLEPSVNVSARITYADLWYRHRIFTLRLIIIPLFTGAEVNLDDRLTPKTDHIIICEYRRDSVVLLDELEELGIEYILIASNEENAKDLSDAGYSVIHGSPQDRDAFKRASIDAARAVITDAGDANVNTILTVRSIDPNIETITLTDDSDMRSALLDAGADTVLSPHGVLGRRLAEKAVSSFSSELTDTIELGAKWKLRRSRFSRETD